LPEKDIMACPREAGGSWERGEGVNAGVIVGENMAMVQNFQTR